MADAWAQAIYDRLAGSAPLVELLGSRGDPPRPSIFTFWPAPGDAMSALYVVTPGAAVNLPFDTKTGLGRQITRYIYVYGPNVGNVTDIEAAAELIRGLFHRHALTVVGYSVYIGVAEGPATAPTGDDMVGRVVTVTWTCDHA